MRSHVQGKGPLQGPAMLLEPVSMREERKRLLPLAAASHAAVVVSWERGETLVEGEASRLMATPEWISCVSLLVCAAARLFQNWLRLEKRLVCCPRL